MKKAEINMMELKALLGLEEVPMSNVKIKIIGTVTPTYDGAIPSGNSVISFEVVA